jgi:hypothetical protein
MKSGLRADHPPLVEDTSGTSSGHDQDALSHLERAKCVQKDTGEAACKISLPYLTPDLQAIMDAWPSLPEPVKAGIIAMVKASKQ